MRLFTAQMARYRQLKDSDAYLLDTTIKSGIKIFAPTWEMVMGVKNGTMSEETYTQLYLERMRDSYRRFTPEWLALFKHEVVVAFCYCPDGCFCHRYQLAEMLGCVAKCKHLPFTYLGELKNASDITTVALIT